MENYPQIEISTSKYFTAHKFSIKKFHKDEIRLCGISIILSASLQ